MPVTRSDEFASLTIYGAPHEQKIATAKERQPFSSTPNVLRQEIDYLLCMVNSPSGLY
jgi:hypothetical protein